MIKALKGLFGLAQREDATTGELVPSLPAAEAELTAARAALEAAETAYRGGLLVPDEAALQRLATARTDASMRVDRAEALVEALGERLADATAREAEAERVARYQAARAQAEDARNALAEFYPSMADDLVRVIEVVALAEVEVARVNKDLPRGAEPLLAVEHEARDIPAVPEEIISERTVERWVRVGDIRPGNFQQSDVYATGHGRGMLQIQGFPVNAGVECELRKFTEQQVQAGSARIIVHKLAEILHLPGFRPGDLEHWAPLSSPARPSDVLRQIERLRFRRPAEAAPKAVTTRLIPQPGAERVRELPRAAPVRA